MASKEADRPSVWQGIVGVVLLVLLGASFFLAQSSLWVHHVVFDEASFTARTTAVLTSQQSRDSIAESITNKVFEDRPVADRILGERTKNFVSSLLGSDISEATLQRVVSTSYVYFTTADRKDIAIDLTSIKDPLTKIVSFVESRGRTVALNTDEMPSEIVLVKSNELPNISHYMQLLIFTGALLWLIAIGSAIGYIFLSREHRIRRIYIALAVLAAVCGIALFTGPFIPPAIASLVNAVPMRSVASSLATTFIAPFAQQLAITLAILIGAGLVVYFRGAFVWTWHKARTVVTTQKPKQKK